MPKIILFCVKGQSVGRMRSFLGVYKIILSCVCCFCAYEIIPHCTEFKIQETKNIAQQGKYSIYTQIWKTLFETWWQPPQVGLLYNSAPRHGLVMVGISDVCIGHITNPELLQSHSLWSAYPPTGWRQWLWSQTDCGAAAGKRSKLHRWGSISREVAQKKTVLGGARAMARIDTVQLLSSGIWAI